MNESIIAQVLETLNRIEGKVDTTGEKLHAHISEEESAVSELRNEISEHRIKSIERHNALMQSFNSYAEKSLVIEAAFLKKDGKPDVEGHYTDHHERKTFWEWVSETKKKTYAKVFETGFVAFIIWLIYEIWIALLKGPAK